MVGKLMADAAEEQLREAAAATSSDDDEICGFVLCEADDRGCGRPVDEHCLVGNAGVAKRCTPVALEGVPDLGSYLGG